MEHEGELVPVGAVVELENKGNDPGQVVWGEEHERERVEEAGRGKAQRLGPEQGAQGAVMAEQVDLHGDGEHQEMGLDGESQRPENPGEAGQGPDAGPVVAAQQDDQDIGGGQRRHQVLALPEIAGRDDHEHDEGRQKQSVPGRRGKVRDFGENPPGQGQAEQDQPEHVQQIDVNAEGACYLRQVGRRQVEIDDHRRVHVEPDVAIQRAALEQLLRREEIPRGIVVDGLGEPQADAGREQQREGREGPAAIGEQAAPGSGEPCRQAAAGRQRAVLARRPGTLQCPHAGSFTAVAGNAAAILTRIGLTKA